MKRIILSLTFLFVLRVAAFATDGMWIPLLLSMLNEKEMREMGMRLTAEDIYSVNNSSLKDAIVHFNGGCTSEIISPEGLLLTNHHCGYRQIQSHSTLENNYLQDGFWAMNRDEELPNKNLTVTLISRIEDVTELALAGVEGDDSRARQSTIDKNLEEIKKNAVKKEWEDVMIKPFFKGNQYFLFVTVTYRDVRLVGAPPSSIGKFGADTDNWVWPRHTGDFSLFRIYADADNRPADYSPDNVPYRPKHYLPISLDGVEPGDFTMVFGFPGRTNSYLPAVAVEQIRDVIDPARISVRDNTLEIWDAAMRKDPEVRIQYASKQAGVANGWKKWQGEVLGLTNSNGIEKKKRLEDKFQKMTSMTKKYPGYQDILPTFSDLYKKIQPYALQRTYYGEITGGRNIEVMRIANYMGRLSRAHENEGEEGFNGFKGRLMGYLPGFYEDYRPELDQAVFEKQMKLLAENIPSENLPDSFLRLLKKHRENYGKIAAEIFDNSFFDNGDQVLSTLKKPTGDVLKAIQNDPLFQLADAFRTTSDEKVYKPYNEINEQIEALQTTYMKALMEVFPKKRFYPDANSTMRISYGKVNGYQPSEDVKYDHMTFLSGVMDKYKPGDYEFDVPEKLRELYSSKDYGNYAQKDAKGELQMPVCFIGSNHTTGGNSGSPAIDAYGNLIGLNFDRVWEGTMSDYNFDEKYCRNIMVDARYILFIIDKFAGAGHLIEEMELVNPKSSPEYLREKKLEEIKRRRMEDAQKADSKSKYKKIKPNYKQAKE